MAASKLQIRKSQIIHKIGWGWMTTMNMKMTWHEKYILAYPDSEKKTGHEHQGFALRSILMARTYRPTFVIIDSRADQLIDLPPHRLGGGDRGSNHRTCWEMTIDGFSRRRTDKVQSCILHRHFSEQSVNTAKNIYIMCAWVSARARA